MPPSSNGRRVLVIGLDGGTFDVIRPLVAEGRLPTFARLLEQGTWGNLESVPNQISPAAWTSFLTGTNPDKHGIFDFHRRRENSYDIEFVNGGSRSGPSLWRLLGEAGKNVGIMNVPMTYPAEPVNGCLVAGLDAPGIKSPGSVYPPELHSRFQERFPDYVVEPGVMHLVKEGRAQDAVATLCAMVATRKKAADYLMDTYPWDLFVLVFRELDPAQHYFWNDPEPARSQGFEGEGNDSGDAIAKVYCSVDRAMGELFSGLDRDTTVIVLSDHGFGPRSLAGSCLNNWLETRGWLAYRNDTASGNVLTRHGRALAQNLLRRSYLLLERNLNRDRRETLIRLLPALRDRVRSRLFFNRIDWDRTAPTRTTLPRTSGSTCRAGNPGEWSPPEKNTGISLNRSSQSSMLYRIPTPAKRWWTRSTGVRRSTTADTWTRPLT